MPSIDEFYTYTIHIITPTYNSSFLLIVTIKLQIIKSIFKINKKMYSVVYDHENDTKVVRRLVIN